VKKFGATVRKLREEKNISLRKFAEAVGISPTYVSKVERDEFPPPGEETIRKMARYLGQDEDGLLGLAGKLASDLPPIVQQRPQLMAAFLRKAGSLSDAKIQNLLKQMDKMHE
jgi:transcriptional regulator with XRE-family HTH domain